MVTQLCDHQPLAMLFAHGDKTQVEPRFRVFFDEIHPEVELISKAVGTFEGSACFQFGMARTETSTDMSPKLDGSCRVGLTKVLVIDFASFLKERVTKGEWVVAKIDVEGTECATSLHAGLPRCPP